MGRKKITGWTVQSFNGKSWETIYTGTEREIRQHFQALLLQPGTKRMLDHLGNQIAKATLSSYDVEFSIKRS